MSDSQRLAAAVEFLGTNPEARRAVLSWHLVPKEIKSRKRMIQEWAKHSTVDETLLDWIADGLFAHKICLDDRTVDPQAMRVIEHMAGDFLRRKLSKSTKKDAGA